MQHAHADHLQREQHGRQRCAEQGGKHAAHAAHGGQRQILFMHAQQRARLVADAAADLQRSAFAAGTAAAQMGDDGG